MVDPIHPDNEILISPTEPERIRTLGTTSLYPEDYGVDIFWESNLGTIGIQRKQFPGDFLSSVQDGRLNKEYAQMKGLDIPFLVLEGRPRWTTEGLLMDGRSRWTRAQHRHYLIAVQLRGIIVIETETITDTLNFTTALREWTNKKDHTGLDTRPAAKGSGWGRVSNLDYQKHLIMGLPNVGPKQATAILDTLGMPFLLKVGVEELTTVPGIGKTRAEKIVEVFRHEKND